MGVSKDSTRSAEDVLSTPEPGESLAVFYAQSRTSHCIPSLSFGADYLQGEYWTQRAHGVSDNRGKLLRRVGFSFAEERYGTSSRTYDMGCCSSFLCPRQRSINLSSKK
jgi:hypothetical protein